MAERERDTLAAGRLPGSVGEVGAALWRLEDARRRTLEVLRDIGDDEVDAAADANTVGTVLYHLGLIETDWLFSEILEQPIPDEFERLFPADDREAAGVLTAVAGQKLGEHLDRLAFVRKTLLAEVKDMTAEDFHRLRHLPQYDVSPAWVLHHLAQHEAEHRGELGSIIAAIRRRA